MNCFIAIKEKGPGKRYFIKWWFQHESSLLTLVCQTESGVEQASEAKSEPKPAPVENGLSHSLSATPKPASQLNTQPQSTGNNTTLLSPQHQTTESVIDFLFLVFSISELYEY